MSERKNTARNHYHTRSYTFVLAQEESIKTGFGDGEGKDQTSLRGINHCGPMIIKEKRGRKRGDANWMADYVTMATSIGAFSSGSRLRLALAPA